MATDVKNTAAGDSGSTKNGSITVKSKRNNYKYQNAANGNSTYLIAKFDLDTDPVDGTNLSNRFDDPKYYTIGNVE
jgi:hypothetical protein